MNNQPTRLLGRRQTTNTPTAVKAAAMSPLWRLGMYTPRPNPPATSTEETSPSAKGTTDGLGTPSLVCSGAIGARASVGAGDTSPPTKPASLVIAERPPAPMTRPTARLW